MIFDAQAKSLVAPPWEGYRFVPDPLKWDRSCHRHPCSQTDHIDRELNTILNNVVRLSPAELDYARRMAIARNNACGDRHANNHSQRPNERIHSEGTACEVALMKWLGIPLKLTINTFKAADLPWNIEVRGRSVSWYDCKVRPGDDNERKVVMGIVSQDLRRIEFRGWIYAWQGKMFKKGDPTKKDPTKKDYEPFHMVPQECLFPMETLKYAIKLEDPGMFTELDWPTVLAWKKQLAL